MADYTGTGYQVGHTGVARPAFGGQDVDNIRRTFGIGDKVHELAPETSIFFSYLSKLGKKPTDETVWKPLEYRNQWQRRNFTMQHVYFSSGAYDDAADIVVAGSTVANTSTHITFEVDYSYQGKKLQSFTSLGTSATGGYSPIFLTKNQIVRIDGTAYKLMAEPIYYTEDPDAANWNKVEKSEAGKARGGFAVVPLASLVTVSTGSGIATEATDSEQLYEGQVIGSQWGEATGAPDGWRDELSAVEFYTQIFKTSVPLMSGSMMATRYRGYANEWKRIYGEHLKSHKMDLENAFLFGYGKYTDQDTRNSWGIEPFIRNNGGKKYQLGYSGTTHGSGSGYDVRAGFHYDGIIDIMDDYMNWEGGNSGQKLCLTSRKVINALHKVGAGNFVSNSLKPEGVASEASGVFRAGMEVKTSSFMPIDITSISTSWGAMNFVAHPLFRNDMEDKAVCVDLSNVSLRPLSGNGVSRDTFVETNVQDNDVDGRKDMIITEAGLEVLLPETHAVIDFEAGA
tara:strand:- start:21976 stop:23508 length:1533 start_codon:yes stop_codon:yes gene_type:complete